MMIFTDKTVDTDFFSYHWIPGRQLDMCIYDIPGLWSCIMYVEYELIVDIIFFFFWSFNSHSYMYNSKFKFRLWFYLFFEKNQIMIRINSTITNYYTINPSPYLVSHITYAYFNYRHFVKYMIAISLLDKCNSLDF